jgi:transposase
MDLMRQRWSGLWPFWKGRSTMLGLGAATRIYVVTGATDMRLGFNGLYGLVFNRLQCDPLSGHLFLFANSQRDRMKVIFFDGSGLWVCSKRMEGGRLRWPEAQSSEDKVQLSREEFALLVGGIDLAQTRKRKWYRRPVG